MYKQKKKFKDRNYPFSLVPNFKLLFWMKCSNKIVKSLEAQMSSPDIPMETYRVQIPPRQLSLSIFFFYLNLKVI